MVKNAAGNFYASENQLRFANLLSGLSARGYSYTLPDNVWSVNFKMLFKTLKALWNVGATIEENDGEQKVRIEELAHFFEDTEVLDLSDRLNTLDIEQESLMEFQYAKIKTGYKKAEYEAVNGRGEYNVNHERTTSMPNDTTFDNVSDYRADTKGLVDLIDEGKSSEDAKGEDDIFIVKSQDGGADWDAETDENVQILNNTSLFQAGSLNLYFTPTRNLLRHDYIFRSGFDAALDTNIIFQKGDKAVTLQTTDGADDITENQDILIDDLSDPLWDAIALTVEVDFYEADYQLIKANTKGYITLSSTLKGWILDLTWQLSNNRATIKLLKKWA